MPQCKSIKEFWFSKEQIELEINAFLTQKYCSHEIYLKKLPKIKDFEIMLLLKSELSNEIKKAIITCQNGQIWLEEITISQDAQIMLKDFITIYSLKKPFYYY